MKNSATLPLTARQLMVRSLAATEGLWLPLRQFHSAGPAVFARRTEPNLRLGGGRVNQRSLTSHWKVELSGMGLMDGASGRLTVAGRLLARTWVWRFQPSELKLAARRLMAAVAANDVLDDRREGLAWVPEKIICGRSWDEQNALLQKCFLPWLADGVLKSGEDGPGFVWYAAVDPNADLVKLAGRVVDRHTEMQPALYGVYDAEFKRARSAAMGDRESYSEIGIMPLPMAGLRSGRKYIGEKNIRPIFELQEAAVDG